EEALADQRNFEIQSTDGTTLYSRAGAFNKNDQGQLVTIDGYEVLPGITIPTGSTELTISRYGQVSAKLPGATDATVLGQLTLADFVNEAGLQ
ncbi:flagellar basal-body rod protein FlgG, partial [Rhizobium ruizarguesonis]